MTNVLKRLKNINSSIINVNQIRNSVIHIWLKSHNIRKVQVMIGHRNISSTERYLINDLEDLHNIVDEFHPLK